MVGWEIIACVGTVKVLAHFPRSIMYSTKRTNYCHYALFQ